TGRELRERRGNDRVAALVGGHARGPGGAGHSANLVLTKSVVKRFWRCPGVGPRVGESSWLSRGRRVGRSCPPMRPGTLAGELDPFRSDFRPEKAPPERGSRSGRRRVELQPDTRVHGCISGGKRGRVVGAGDGSLVRRWVVGAGN